MVVSVMQIPADTCVCAHNRVAEAPSVEDYDPGTAHQALSAV